jgi:hypothetical protein
MSVMVHVHTAVPSLLDKIVIDARQFWSPDSPPVNREKPRDWGLITIQVIDFIPSSVRSTPPSISDGCCGEVACMFAYAFNQSPWARERRRWAMVSNTGSIVTISAVNDADRPTDPAGFPPVVTTGFTAQEAILAAEEQNRPRFALARVPRLWTIAVMPISAEGSVA